MKGVNDDQTRGIDIVRRALQSPIRQIAENAGHDGAVVAGKLIDGEDQTMGFNAQTEVYENLVQAGVIDPTKVVRTALQDAASVAGLLITTEAAVSEMPEDKSSGRRHARRRNGRNGRNGFLVPRSRAKKKGRGGDSPALSF
jgi:chaperonin GroEL